MNFAPHASSPTSASAGKRTAAPMMFTSFDVPEWTVPSSVICDATADKYMHLFTSFEVPGWMLQGDLGISRSAACARKAQRGGKLNATPAA